VGVRLVAAGALARLGAGLGVLGVLLALALAALALLALALAVALLAGAVLRVALAQAAGQLLGGVGHVLLLVAQPLLVHAVALGPGADGLLGADDLAQPLEQLGDPLLLAAQLLVAVVGQEDVQDGPDVVGQVVIPAEHVLQVVRRDRLAGGQHRHELVELGVGALLAGLFEGLAQDDGLVAVLGLAAGLQPLLQP